MLSHRGNIVPRRQPIPCTREYQPACSLDARAVAFRRLDRLSSETAAPSGNVPAVNRRAALRAAAASPFHMRDDNDLTLIGTCQESDGISSVTRPFGIRRADRRGHLIALGKTGTGKTTLLERLIRQ